MITIEDVYEVNQRYFSEDNKTFFCDISYDVITDDNNETYLLTFTNKWSDMLDGIKKPCYILKNLNQDTLKVGNLINEEFKTIKDVRFYLCMMKEK